MAPPKAPRRAKRPPDTVVSLLSRWPSLQMLASELGISYFTASAWRHRGKIPQAWWSAIERAAIAHKIPRVSYDVLREIHDAMRPIPPVSTTREDLPASTGKSQRNRHKPRAGVVQDAQSLASDAVHVSDHRR